MKCLAQDTELRRWSCIIAAGAALLAAAVPPSAADIVHFTANPQGGWTAPVSWNDGEGPVPGDGDIALFDHPDESRLVNWFTTSQNTSLVDRWVLRRGETRFRIYSSPAGTVLISMLSESALAPGLVIGDEPQSVASLVFGSMIASDTLRTFTAVSGALAWAPGSHGRLAIERHAIQFLFSGRLDVGRAGVGSIEVTEPSFVEAARLELGAAMSGTGTVLLAGGARLDVAEDCHVGGLGHGEIVLSDSARLTCRDLMLGRSASASGSVLVSGASTSLVVADSADVGFLGAGDLAVTDGAGVFIGGFLSVGMASSGSITIDGPGSNVWITGDVFLGTGLTPQIHVARGARMRVDGQLRRLISSGGFSGSLHLLVSSPHQYPWEPAVRSAGGSTAIPITLALDPALAPVRGMTIELVHSSGGVISTPALTLPALPPHLVWRVISVPGRLAVRIASAADFDGDDAVGHSDLLALLAAWGACPEPPAPCAADLNGDGSVDLADLLILMAAWGPES